MGIDNRTHSKSGASHDVSQRGCCALDLLCARQIFRVLTFAVLLWVGITTWFAVTWSDREVVVFGAVPGQPLTLEVDNCQVLLGRVNEPGRSMGFIRDTFSASGNNVSTADFMVGVTMPSLGGTIKESTPGVLRIINDPEAVNGALSCRNRPYDCRMCRVFVLARTADSWPSVLTLKSNDTQQTVEVTDFAFGDRVDAASTTLVLEGANMHVALNYARLARVEAELTHGSLHLPGLTLTGSGPAAAGGGEPSFIHTAHGDVFASFNHPVNATYAQSHARTCLVSPDVAMHEETCTTWNDTVYTPPTQNGNATWTVQHHLSCRGSAVLCAADEPYCAGDADLQHINVVADDGSVHVSVVRGVAEQTAHLLDARLLQYEEIDEYLPECATTSPPTALSNITILSGAGMIGPTQAGHTLAANSSTGVTQQVGIHSSSNITLRGVRQWLDEEPGFDFVVYIHLEGLPPHDIWAYASKPAIVQLDPGWLSTFSVSLLRPRVRHVQLRLAPGLCPAGLAHSTSYGGALEEVLREHVGLRPGQALFHMMGPRMCRYQLVGASSTSGLPLYSRRDASIWSNTALVIAISISAVLSVCTGCFGCLALRSLTQWSVQQYKNGQKEAKRYRKLKDVVGMEDAPKVVARRRTTAHDRQVVRRKLQRRRGSVVASSAAGAAGAGAITPQPPKKDTGCWSTFHRAMKWWWDRFRRKTQIWFEFLPAPFDTAQLAVTYMLKTRRNSLQVFLRAKMKAQKASQSAGWAAWGCNCCTRAGAAGNKAEEETTRTMRYPLKSFKARYDGFAWEYGFFTMPLDGALAKQTLKSYGCHVELEEVEVWEGVRFRTASERSAMLDSRPQATESSLGWFLRTACRVSGLTLETIPVRQLEREYNKFIARRRGAAAGGRDAEEGMLRPSTAAMQALGVTRGKQTQATLVSTEYTLLEEGEEDIHVPLMKDLKRLVTRNDLMVFVYDLGLVFISLVGSSLLPAAGLAFALWAQTQQTKVSSPDVTLLSPGDLMLAPWNILYRTLGKDTVALLVCSGICLVVHWLELLCYISVPYLSGFQGTQEGEDTRSVARRLLQVGALLSFATFFGFLCAYATGVSVWLLLGAVLNPETFLPFAVGVVTVYGFVTTRVDRLRRSTQEAEAMIMGYIQDHLGENIASSLQSNVVDPLMEGKALTVTQLATATATLVQDTPLGDVAADLGIDVGSVAGLVSGDEAAVKSIAQSINIDERVVAAIVAAVRQDEAALADAVAKLCENPVIRADGPSLVALVQCIRCETQSELFTRLAKLAEAVGVANGVPLDSGMVLMVINLMVHHRSSVDTNQFLRTIETPLARANADLGAFVSVLRLGTLLAASPAPTPDERADILTDLIDGAGPLLCKVVPKDHHDVVEFAQQMAKVAAGTQPIESLGSSKLLELVIPDVELRRFVPALLSVATFGQALVRRDLDAANAAFLQVFRHLAARLGVRPDDTDAIESILGFLQLVVPGFVEAAHTSGEGAVKTSLSPQQMRAVHSLRHIIKLKRRRGVADVSQLLEDEKLPVPEAVPVPAATAAAGTPVAWDPNDVSRPPPDAILRRPGHRAEPEIKASPEVLEMMEAKSAEAATLESKGDDGEDMAMAPPGAVAMRMVHHPPRRQPQHIPDPIGHQAPDGSTVIPADSLVWFSDALGVGATTMDALLRVAARAASPSGGTVAHVVDSVLASTMAKHRGETGVSDCLRICSDAAVRLVASSKPETLRGALNQLLAQFTLIGDFRDGTTSTASPHATRLMSDKNKLGLRIVALAGARMISAEHASARLCKLGLLPLDAPVCHSLGDLVGALRQRCLVVAKIKRGDLEAKMMSRLALALVSARRSQPAFLLMQLETVAAKVGSTTVEKALAAARSCEPLLDLMSMSVVSSPKQVGKSGARVAATLGLPAATIRQVVSAVLSEGGDEVRVNRLMKSLGTACEGIGPTSVVERLDHRDTVHGVNPAKLPQAVEHLCARLGLPPFVGRIILRQPPSAIIPGVIDFLADKAGLTGSPLVGIAQAACEGPDNLLHYLAVKHLNVDPNLLIQVMELVTGARGGTVTAVMKVVVQKVAAARRSESTRAKSARVAQGPTSEAPALLVPGPDVELAALHTELVSIEDLPMGSNLFEVAASFVSVSRALQVHASSGQLLKTAIRGIVGVGLTGIPVPGGKEEGIDAEDKRIAVVERSVAVLERTLGVPAGLITAMVGAARHDADVLIEGVGELMSSLPADTTPRAKHFLALTSVAMGVTDHLEQLSTALQLDPRLVVTLVLLSNRPDVNPQLTSGLKAVVSALGVDRGVPMVLSLIQLVKSVGTSPTAAVQACRSLGIWMASPTIEALWHATALRQYVYPTSRHLTVLERNLKPLLAPLMCSTAGAAGIVALVRDHSALKPVLSRLPGVSTNTRTLLESICSLYHPSCTAPEAIDLRARAIARAANLRKKFVGRIAVAGCLIRQGRLDGLRLMCSGETLPANFPLDEGSRRELNLPDDVKADRIEILRAVAAALDCMTGTTRASALLEQHLGGDDSPTLGFALDEFAEDMEDMDEGCGRRSYEAARPTTLAEVAAPTLASYLLRHWAGKATKKSKGYGYKAYKIYAAQQSSAYAAQSGASPRMDGAGGGYGGGGSYGGGGGYGGGAPQYGAGPQTVEAQPEDTVKAVFKLVMGSITTKACEAATHLCFATHIFGDAPVARFFVRNVGSAVLTAGHMHDAGSMIVSKLLGYPTRTVDTTAAGGRSAATVRLEVTDEAVAETAASEVNYLVALANRQPSCFHNLAASAEVELPDADTLELVMAMLAGRFEDLSDHVEMLDEALEAPAVEAIEALLILAQPDTTLHEATAAVAVIAQRLRLDADLTTGLVLGGITDNRANTAGSQAALTVACRPLAEHLDTNGELVAGIFIALGNLGAGGTVFDEEDAQATEGAASSAVASRTGATGSTAAATAGTSSGAASAANAGGATRAGAASARASRRPHAGTRTLRDKWRMAVHAQNTIEAVLLIANPAIRVPLVSGAVGGAGAGAAATQTPSGDDADAEAAAEARENRLAAANAMAGVISSLEQWAHQATNPDGVMYNIGDEDKAWQSELSKALGLSMDLVDHKSAVHFLVDLASGDIARCVPLLKLLPGGDRLPLDEIEAVACVLSTDKGDLPDTDQMRLVARVFAKSISGSLPTSPTLRDTGADDTEAEETVAAVMTSVLRMAVGLLVTGAPLPAILDELKQVIAALLPEEESTVALALLTLGERVMGSGTREGPGGLLVADASMGATVRTLLAKVLHMVTTAAREGVAATTSLTVAALEQLPIVRLIAKGVEGDAVWFTSDECRLLLGDVYNMLVDDEATLEALKGAAEGALTAGAAAATGSLATSAGVGVAGGRITLPTLSTDGARGAALGGSVTVPLFPHKPAPAGVDEAIKVLQEVTHLAFWGFSGHVAKPITPNTLIGVIDKFATDQGCPAALTDLLRQAFRIGFGHEDKPPEGMSADEADARTATDIRSDAAGEFVRLVLKAANVFGDDESATLWRNAGAGFIRAVVHTALGGVSLRRAETSVKALREMRARQLFDAGLELLLLVIKTEVAGLVGTAAAASMGKSEAEREVAVGRVRALVSGAARFLMDTDDVEDLAEALGVHEDVVTGFVALGYGQPEGVLPLARYLGSFSEKEMGMLVKLLRVIPWQDGKGGGGDGTDSKGLEVSAAAKNSLDAVTKDRNLHLRVFEQMDADGSGLLSFDEFRQALLYFKLQISRHYALELFARVSESGTGDYTPPSDDAGDLPHINQQQFREAIEILQADVTAASMGTLGLNRRDLYLWAAVLVLVLVVIIAFLFVGVVAYTNATSFSAVVNSIMTGFAGIGVAMASTQNRKQEEIKGSTPDAVAGAVHIVSE